MIVQELLDARDTDVVTISPSATLAETAAILTTHRIGALVVTDPSGRVLGIISERDLAKAIVRFAEALFDRRVEDVMTPTVVTCSPEDSIVEVLYLMNTKHIRHIPILDREALVGIVSVRDITGEWLELLEQENRQLRDHVGGALKRSA